MQIGGEFMEVKFYSKPNCELCTEGLTLLNIVLEDVPFSLNMINIEEDDEAHERYMLMIPVVEVNGEIIQYGRLDYVTLLEALSNY